jgi:hypothetical protein
VTAYTIKTAVNGEYATTEGLVAFEYAAGTVKPNGDEHVLAMLADAGLATIADETKQAKKADTPAVSDTVKE